THAATEPGGCALALRLRSRRLKQRQIGQPVALPTAVAPIVPSDLHVDKLAARHAVVDLDDRPGVLVPATHPIADLDLPRVHRIRLRGGGPSCTAHQYNNKSLAITQGFCVCIANTTTYADAAAMGPTGGCRGWYGKMQISCRMQG